MRLRVKLDFVVDLHGDSHGMTERLLDGFEGAVRGLWPGVDATIEPDGHAEFTTMTAKRKKSGTAPGAQ